ncbi:uncharacterized protein LOC108431875 [Pygocentrus nattereri]|uniref:uncharacterized protein LOC108431875 n=1 Tax=Pygocentrus nattereri TaxID=42514 RepID=UPI00081433F3|nr:uncharacterized protein LOC108431875 [Pygocentrus nattereri]XP_017560819.1 uncharacterized protein LOC108431875 [Pygocentrus nattereri]XP_017560821.1 uncharacterized protein LOC108431875 [Pygocentrus nattereri]XP_037401598.1 uncharacterized protein LOC108431875 [Pygocentrus nattereri]
MRQPSTTRSFRKWSKEAEETLRDCFASTDWSVLHDSHSKDIEGVTDCTTDYLNFCMDTVVPVRTVRCFPNNKPWITSDVKDLLNKKKRAFKDKNQEELRNVQRELKSCLKEAKETYRKKVEQKLHNNNMKEVWDSMRTITGCKPRSDSVTAGGVERANELNLFYNRFDCPVSSSSASVCPAITATSASAFSVLHRSPHHRLSAHTVHPPHFSADQVTGVLRRLRSRKTAGPDKMSPRLLKACASELELPLSNIFNMSLQLGRVPTLWKTSCLVPVPKKPHPSELNDYRPVALTSHIMKTMERLLIPLLRPQVQHALDPLQFAYRERIGVKDAITYLLH